MSARYAPDQTPPMNGFHQQDSRQRFSRAAIGATAVAIVLFAALFVTQSFLHRDAGGPASMTGDIVVDADVLNIDGTQLSQLDAIPEDAPWLPGPALVTDMRDSEDATWYLTCAFQSAEESGGMCGVYRRDKLTSAFTLVHDGIEHGIYEHAHIRTVDVAAGTVTLRFIGGEAAVLWGRDIVIDISTGEATTATSLWGLIPCGDIIDPLDPIAASCTEEAIEEARAIIAWWEEDAALHAAMAAE